MQSAPVGTEGRKKSSILLQWPFPSYLHVTSMQTRWDGWRETGQGWGGRGGVSVFEKWKVKWGLTELGVGIQIKHIDGGVQG